MTTAPDLSGYRAVHLALRGGADAMATVAATIQPSNRPKAAALARYWAGYSREVLTHHRTEDDLFFPVLVERVPFAADLIRRTDAEHHELDEVMARCEAAVRALAQGTRTDDLPSAFEHLARHMAVHLDFEDEDILPLFERHFTGAEYEELDRKAVAALGFADARFTVPFVMHFATDEMRRAALDGAPLPLRIVYRLTRRPHARLTTALFGTAAPAAPTRRRQVAA